MRQWYKFQHCESEITSYFEVSFLDKDKVCLCTTYGNGTEEDPSEGEDIYLDEDELEQICQTLLATIKARKEIRNDNR